MIFEIFIGLLLSGAVATAIALSPMLIGVLFVSPDSVPAFLFHYGFLLFVLGFVVDLVGTSTGLALREKYFLRRARPASFGLERKSYRPRAAGVGTLVALPETPGTEECSACHVLAERGYRVDHVDDRARS